MHEDAAKQAFPQEEILNKKRRYFGNFAIRHREEMRKLVEGKVLGNEAGGWRNVAEHNLLAGVVADKIGLLAGLPEKEQRELVSVAATHDWDKRLDKERVKEAERLTQNGTVIVLYNIDKEIRQEQNKKGLVRVTGNDWRDFDTWGIKEKILRYIDSGLFTGPDAHADFVDWRERVDELRRTYPDINKKAGEEMYKMPLYDKLAQINEQIETELYEIISSAKPELAQKYPRKDMLSDLIRDQIIQDIYKY